MDGVDLLEQPQEWDVTVSHEEGPIAQHIVEAVASFHETDLTELAPLYTAIDPDALEKLYEHAPPGQDTVFSVTFEYENLAVAIDDDHTIKLSEDPGPGQRSG